MFSKEISEEISKFRKHSDSFLWKKNRKDSLDPFPEGIPYWEEICKQYREEPVKRRNAWNEVRKPRIIIKKIKRKY